MREVRAAMGKLWAAFAIAMAMAMATIGIASEARADGVCIDDKAKQALSCAGAQPRAIDAAHAGTSFHGVAPPAKANASAPPPPKPREEPPRDDRTIRLQARQIGLLVASVQRLETLLAATKANAPDRAQILRRLADEYVELESAAFRDETEAQIRKDAPKAAESDKWMRGARKKAIETYRRLADDYPQHPQIDEILYYLAYEHEQAGDAKSARSVYYDLIKRAPNSKYVPNAYLAFGELFYIEAQGDPAKWPLAAQAYAEVVKYPAPANKVQGFAYYKLAYVYWNTGELDKALSAFKKTIDVAAANPTLPGAGKLAEAARRDVIPVYALKGDPARAHDFFRLLGGDALVMMDALGTSYIDTGHYPEAITLYRDLVARDKGPRVCGYQARIAEATMAMKSSDKEAIRAELENQLRAASGNKEHACQSRTAALVAETAMAWHIEAVGTPGQRGTNDTHTMALAAQLYQRVVDTWTAKDLESFEFPRLVKEDWPTLYEIRASMADLLYAEKDWKRCGPAFDAVFAMDPKNADAARWAYAAGLCYQNEWEKTHQGEAAHSSVAHAQNASSLAPKPLTNEQKAMIGAFDRYVCNVKPTDAAGEEQMIEVAYARARTYFEAQHWDEAALAFRAIAMDHAGTDSGVWAAQLYLEAENVLVRSFSRGACVSEMTADVPKLLELHCSGDRAQKNADAYACTGLRVVQVDLQRLEAERLVAAGEYERGGQLYYDLFRRSCQDPVAAGQKPQAEKCDEIAYDAAKAFQAARLLAKAITVRRALVAYDERLHLSSTWTKKATYEIGAAFQAIAVYEQAAEWYERYAKADARADKADQALSDAVLLRLGLGQVDDALRDAKDFMARYGATKPAQTAAIAYALGAHHAERGDWEMARAALAPAMSVVDRAPPDLQIQAHAVLGRAYESLRRPAQAHAEYARVRSLWADPGAAEKKIRDAYPNEDDAARDRRVTRTITCVGEALFFFAEERRVAEVEPLKFPEYKGPGDKASVKAHVETKVKDWYTRKMAAIQRVEPEYWKILELAPAPPPRWVIAAGSRTGLMWGDFVDDFRRSPIPRAWRGTELERIYVDTIDLKSAPFKEAHAKPALQKCLSLATKYQYFDDYSRSCEVWLAKNYKQEYHVVDELRGAASLANGALAERMPPILASGASFRGR